MVYAVYGTVLEGVGLGVYRVVLRLGAGVVVVYLVGGGVYLVVGG